MINATLINLLRLFHSRNVTETRETRVTKEIKAATATKYANNQMYSLPIFLPLIPSHTP